MSAKVLADVDDKSAADLLLKLLQPNPAKRIGSMDEVLRHAFFQKSTGGSGGDEAAAATAALVAMSTRLGNIEEQNSKILQMTEAIAQRTQTLTVQSDKLHLQLRQTERIMCRAAFEATEVLVPTCFVILSQKLKPPTADKDEKKEEGRKKDIGRRAEREGQEG
jgi:hypothetical protein